MDDLSKEILTEIENEKLTALADDPIIFSAIKKYILAVAYKHGVIERGLEHKGNLNAAFALSWAACQGKGIPIKDEELGQNLRALTYAVQMVESGFDELAELKKPEVVKELEDNPAE